MSDELAFHPRWVAPYYAELMNLNFLRLPTEEQAAFASRFRQVVQDIPNPIVTELLQASWRPSKVAAWVIACRRDSSFTALLAEQLFQRPKHVEHLCIALARTGAPSAYEALLRYVTTYLDPRNIDLGNMDGIGTTWAIASLQCSADDHASDIASAILSHDGPWKRFLNGSDTFPTLNGKPLWSGHRWRELWSDRLDHHIRSTSRGMAFLAEHFD